MPLDLQAAGWLLTCQQGSPRPAPKSFTIICQRKSGLPCQAPMGNFLSLHFTTWLHLLHLSCLAYSFSTFSFTPPTPQGRHFSKLHSNWKAMPPRNTDLLIHLDPLQYLHSFFTQRLNKRIIPDHIYSTIRPLHLSSQKMKDFKQ